MELSALNKKGGESRTDQRKRRRSTLKRGGNPVPTQAHPTGGNPTPLKGGRRRRRGSSKKKRTRRRKSSRRHH
jgi:hypothetical protein